MTRNTTRDNQSQTDYINVMLIFGRVHGGLHAGVLDLWAECPGCACQASDARNPRGLGWSTLPVFTSPYAMSTWSIND